MDLSFGTLAVLCSIAAIVWFWHDALRVREFANAAAMAACERMGLQFLDGTAAFARFRLVRDQGRLRLLRTYVFDYTSQSIERRQGFVILAGTSVEYIGFASEHAARPSPPSAPMKSATESSASSTDSGDEAGSGDLADNVFDLNAHRERRAAQRDVSPKRGAPSE
jgi:hypothetical protein